jgi:hypothetical protein
VTLKQSRRRQLMPLPLAKAQKTQTNGLAEGIFYSKSFDLSTRPHYHRAFGRRFYLELVKRGPDKRQVSMTECAAES